MPLERLRIGAAGTFETHEDAEQWRLLVRSAFPESPVSYTPLPCSIACHVGVGAIGIGVSVIEKRAS